MTTEEVRIIRHNQKLYAQLMSIREERKMYQSKLDVEIALCGSKLFHFETLNDKDIAPSSKIFAKLINLYYKERVLIQNYEENLKTLKEIRQHETKSR